jgi:hypothetical protein
MLPKSFTESKRHFEGAVLDTGAARTVIGHLQARAYMRSIGRKLRAKASRARFRFGDTVVDSIGSIAIRIPFCDSSFVVEAAIVPLDVPFLLGLDAMDKFELELNIAEDKLSRHGKSESITRSRGHLVYGWPPSMRNICFTKLELFRAHRSFAHPSPGKLYRLLLRARPESAPKDLLADLQRISDHCSTCQRFSKRPLRFMTALPSEYGLGEEISVDLMSLQGRSVLHVVDSSTSYSSAAFLTAETAIGVWQALVTCWITFMPGFPRTIRSDSGPQFTSETWKRLCDGVGVSIKISPVDGEPQCTWSKRATTWTSSALLFES